MPVGLLHLCVKDALYLDCRRDLRLYSSFQVLYVQSHAVIADCMPLAGNWRIGFHVA